MNRLDSIHSGAVSTRGKARQGSERSSTGDTSIGAGYGNTLIHGS